MHIYNEDFYDYQSKGSIQSARVVIDILSRYLKLESVLDIGCGVGSWLKVYKEQGTAVVGIDGEYVSENQLLIAKDEFVPYDLKNEANLNQRFSLAQSLEVAEHIPEEYADNFVRSLTNHSDFVMFSAAVLGQGGEDHVNEKPLDYWKEKFSNVGYDAYDLVRPNLKNHADVELVEKWYRYNTVLYIKRGSENQSLEDISRFKVPPQKKLDVYSDTLWTLRKAVVRLMPEFLSTLIARIKAKIISASR